MIFHPGEAHPGAQVTIRPVTAADYPRLAALCGQLWYPTTLEQIEQRLAQFRQDQDHCIFVADLDQSSVVGWVYVYLTPSLLHDPQAEIGGLVVDEAYRGQKIGEYLLRKAEQWAVDHGCWAVSVHSNVIRTDAHRFYERLGYQVIKTQLALRRVL